MLSLFRRASRFPAGPRPCLCLPTRRSISWTLTRWSSAAPEPPTPEEEAELEATSPETTFVEQLESLDGHATEGKHKQEISYNEWLKTIGAQYKSAKPNNWLGGDVVGVSVVGLTLVP